MVLCKRIERRQSSFFPSRCLASEPVRCILPMLTRETGEIHLRNKAPDKLYLCVLPNIVLDAKCTCTSPIIFSFRRFT